MSRAQVKIEGAKIEVHLKSRRAPYTRGGVRFTSNRETIVLTPDDLTDAQLEKLAEDTAITIQIFADGVLVDLKLEDGVAGERGALAAALERSAAADAKKAKADAEKARAAAKVKADAEKAKADAQTKADADKGEG